MVTVFQTNGDIENTRADLLRDFTYETLAPVSNDVDAVRLCLKNNDDAGARYHLKRAVACMKAAATSLNELEALMSGGAA